MLIYCQRVLNRGTCALFTIELVHRTEGFVIIHIEIANLRRHFISKKSKLAQIEHNLLDRSIALRLN